MKIDLLILHLGIKNANAKKTLTLIEERLVKRSIKYSFSALEDCEVFMENGEVDIFFNGLRLDDVSSIFFRKVGEKKELAFIISLLSKKKGIKFLDKLYLDCYNSTKLVQTFLFHINKIPSPKTYYSESYDKEKILKAIKFLGLPVVIKELNSSQGKGVSLLKDEAHAEEALELISNKRVILQEFIENDYEYRLLVLGDSVAIAEKKTRDKTSGEFRNNVHLGASEEFIDVDKIGNQLKKIALDSSVVTNIQIAGVDIIVNKKGEAFVTEANSAPAFTHDESVSEEIPKLVSFLKEWIEKK